MSENAFVKILTKETREILGRPLGRVVSEAEAITLLRGRKSIATIGDFCSAALLGNGVRPDIVIYDHRCLRVPAGREICAKLDGYDGGAVRVKNPAGTITDGLVAAVKALLGRGVGKILVDGEEDLAALVVLMYAADGMMVVYGQPKEGMVVIEAGEKTREMACAIFEKMKRA